MGVSFRYHGYTNNCMISSKNKKEAGIPSLNLPGQPWIVTKKEQFNSTRRKYKTEINDPHTACCNALRTTHQLQKIVNKFNKELQSLMSGSTLVTSSILDTSRLERIKVSSSTFTEIISDSDTFGQELSQIKKAYDHRLDRLLRTVNHDVLTFTPEMQTREADSSIVTLQQQIKVLESQVMELLKNNEKLKEEMTSEEELLKMAMMSINDDESQDSRESIVGDHKFDYADRVSTIQAKIYHAKQEIQNSISRRSGLVPISVCQKMEQCIRTCELDIQRLRKQNLILQNNVQEYENKLQRYLEATRTPPESAG